MAAHRQLLWQRQTGAELGPQPGPQPGFQPKLQPGLEHLLVGQGWASGTVIGLAGNQPFTLLYRLEVGAEGFLVAGMRRVSGQASLTLSRTLSSRWQGNNGEELRDLSGCTDLDLSMTPYTKTLALRRLKLLPGQSGELLAALIEVPTLTRRAVRQRYTRLGPHTYRYENLSSGDGAELTVDDELFVRDGLGSSG